MMYKVKSNLAPKRTKQLFKLNQATFACEIWSNWFVPVPSGSKTLEYDTNKNKSWFFWYIFSKEHTKSWTLENCRICSQYILYFDYIYISFVQFICFKFSTTHSLFLIDKIIEIARESSPVNLLISAINQYITG